MPYGLDETYLHLPTSSDLRVAQDLHSGATGHGHCAKIGLATDILGKIVLVQSGLDISKTPRGGDGILTAVTITAEMAQAASNPPGQQHPAPFLRFLRSGIWMVTDLGYVFIPNNVRLGQTTTTLTQFCTDNDINHIWPFRAKDKKAVSYDASSHTISIIDNPDEERHWLQTAVG